MARSLTAPQIAALDALNTATALLLELDFSTALQRWTTAAAPVIWAGNTYQHGVDPSWIEPVRETELSEAVGLKLKLSGVPEAQRSAALLYPVQGRRFTIWTAILSTTSYQIIGDPVPEFEGQMDIVSIEYGDKGEVFLVLEVESDEARFLRPQLRRYTDRDHQQRFPGDTICRFTSQTERTVVWPAASFFRR